MGSLHSTHMDLSVAARWSTRWLALVSVGGWAAEYFTPSIRPYLVLFSRAVGLWARGGAWWLGPPVVAARVHVFLGLPPLAAAVTLSGGWGLYSILRARRRRAAPASAQRGSWITSSIELRRQGRRK